MTGQNKNPFWNQDAIMAAALAFAGMAVVQSKLFPVASWTELPWLRSLLDSGMMQWWPLVLIVAGITWWGVKVFERRRTGAKQVAVMGGQRGTRNQN